MDPRLHRLYESELRLEQSYIRDVLKLEGAAAERVSNISGGIHKNEAELLARLVEECAPVLSVEIGLGFGFAALAICTSARTPGHRHIAIDPHQSAYWNGRGLANLIEAGFDSRFQLIEDYSYSALPRLVSEGLRADLVFIDGWHTFDFVFVDFFYSDKLLKPGGLVIFDDADWPSIRPVIRYAITNLGYEVAGTLPEKGARNNLDIQLGIEGSCVGLRKPSTPKHRAVFFHEPFC